MTNARSSSVLAAAIVAVAFVLAWRGATQTPKLARTRPTPPANDIARELPPSTARRESVEPVSVQRRDVGPNTETAAADPLRNNGRVTAALSMRERNRRRALALLVAKVAANEGALHNHEDAALIWQTVRVNGDKARDGRLGWLRRHSKRVAGREPCVRGNCFWTPHLTRSAREPRGFIGGSDFWADVTAPAWLDLLDYVDELVRFDLHEDDVCPIPPRTWGSLDLDLEGALKRGLYPIGCNGPSNDGFAEAATCMPNTTWLCAPIPIFPRSRVQTKATVIAAAEARPTR